MKTHVPFDSNSLVTEYTAKLEPQLYSFQRNNGYFDNAIVSRQEKKE